LVNPGFFGQKVPEINDLAGFNEADITHSAGNTANAIRRNAIM
jgi:hypothetical protein